MTTSQLHADDAGHGHVIPLPIYFAVYGALVVLTVVTVGVSYAGLGPAAIYVAMAVAIVKASLVAAYFMHLRYDTGFNALVFLASLLFLVLFFSFTMIDIASRDNITKTEGNYTLRHDRAVASAKAAHPPAPASAVPASPAPTH